ncbi:DNA/RNA helicase domain-containing protein [Ligilactobacillus agilis]|uniref:DNA/RNA helicase domain-containing protein n=1 Tax=Ligilactobacillus agilis TaxID=1601 RepID=UPI001438002A|nr:DNA/RNA helicase domain-containing protein [Ligilactobacillus agilis]GET10380.1 ATP/GTP-binding protein [Ligilactobacillus agilis]
MKKVMKTVNVALELSRSAALANELWNYEHENSIVNPNDSEYKSWRNSLPVLLELLSQAGFGENDILFEYPSIATGGRIDAVLVGKNHQGIDTLVTIELKQWSFVGDPTSYQVKDVTEVAIPLSMTMSPGNPDSFDIRRHPLQQVRLYQKDLSRNNSAVKSASAIAIKPLVFLHNCEDVSLLLSGKYQAWQTQSTLGKSIFGKNDVADLIAYLTSDLTTVPNHDFAQKFAEAQYMLQLSDLQGLRSVLAGQENALMVQDQEAVDHFVQKKLRALKNAQIKRKQMIVVSGQPGTGKTIVGLHFLYDYAKIFNTGLQNLDEVLENNKNVFDNKTVKAAFVLPRSRTVHEVIDQTVGLSVPYLGWKLPRDNDLLIIDEAHRIQDLKKDLDLAFSRADIVIILQDDKQRILPNERGTVRNFYQYAQQHGIEFSHQELKIQKRSGLQGNLVAALDTLFYDNKPLRLDTPLEVEVHATPQSLERMIKNDAYHNENHRNKLIAPFDWVWNKRDSDISIQSAEGLFQKPWNPVMGLQAAWYDAKGKDSIDLGSIDKVGCIYTTQGLEFDNVGFIWGPDFRWNKLQQKWVIDVNSIQDNGLKNNIQKSSQEEAELIMKNIYRILLTRATKRLGIYFMDDDTREHVQQYLGI